MRFGRIPLCDAQDAILAHAVALPEGRMGKGTRLGAADIAVLSAAGIDTVVAARLGPEDIDEDMAAGLIASAMPRDHMTTSAASTGRVNLHAAADGLFVAARAQVDRFNRIDPAITLACLADHVAVRAGDMVATIKIIPLAVAKAKAERAAAVLADGHAFQVKPFRARDVALIATRLPSLKPTVMDKTRRVLEDRLRRSGSRLTGEERVAHAVEPLARALDMRAPAHGLVVVFGASAVADADDVIPAAIRAAGGVVQHVGMPVDPGNLLVIGSIGATTIIGAPGCARSPKENGFDWVLDRVLAGEAVGSLEITGLGVGGLLAEIPTRPRPRAARHEPAPGATPTREVRAIVLAAGQARRMGAAGQHKLLAEIAGEPLVRRTARAALDAGLSEVTVVTGHRAPEIRAALGGLAVGLVHNDDYSSGMASSLIAGLDAADRGDVETEGLLVLLADMPGIDAPAIRSLVSAFAAEGGHVVVRAVSAGKRGNPVILPRALFSHLRRLEGDVGARHVIETGGLPVVDVEIGPAAHLDLDTPDAILAVGGVLRA
jgi:molybdenum cofactor cytidylyltransferase